MNAISNGYKDVFLGLIMSLIVSTVLVLVFALFVKFMALNDDIIKIGNISIKIISILIGALIGIRIRTKGFLKGIVLGLLYILLSFLFFSLLSGKVQFNDFKIIDLGLGAVVGGISGIISVNKRARAR